MASIRTAAFCDHANHQNTLVVDTRFFSRQSFVADKLEKPNRTSIDDRNWAFHCPPGLKPKSCPFRGSQWRLPVKRKDRKTIRRWPRSTTRIVYLPCGSVIPIFRVLKKRFPAGFLHRLDLTFLTLIAKSIKDAIAAQCGSESRSTWRWTSGRKIACPYRGRSEVRQYI